MRSTIARPVFALIAMMSGVMAAGAQNASEDHASEVVAWARTKVIELPEFPSVETHADSVKAVVGAARVVALGEPTHGAEEPLALRNGLFRYLVEHLGFTAIALESGLVEAKRVNDFVMGGAGDAKQIARDNLTWGVGAYAQNVQLLQWLRQYNDDLAHARKVKFYGIDLTGGDEGGQFKPSRIALDDALAYLQRLAPEDARVAHAELQPFLDRFTRGQYAKLSADEQKRLRAAVENLIHILERKRQRLIDASSEHDYEWALRSAISGGQMEELFRLCPPDAPDNGLSPDLYSGWNARDADMADNVQWVLRREGPAGRIFVFAHNVHVENTPLRGGIWNVFRQPLKPMGQHLRAALGEQLLIIGTSSAKNGAGVPAATEQPGSLDTVLSRVGPKHFLLDIRLARQAPAALSWLGQRQSLRANFTTQMELAPASAFDAIAFMDELTAAHPADAPR